MNSDGSRMHFRPPSLTTHVEAGDRTRFEFEFATSSGRSVSSGYQSRAGPGSRLRESSCHDMLLPADGVMDISRLLPSFIFYKV